MLILVFLSLIIWLYLVFFRGKFWLNDQFLETIATEKSPKQIKITAIIPARDEAESIGQCLKSLFEQDYNGEFNIVLIDDRSEDNTKEIALQTAKECDKEKQLTIVDGEPLEKGWSGKLWAMHQGIKWAESNLQSDYFLFTDADILHSKNNLSSLVVKAEKENLDLVSLMVKLNCESFWEKMLIPAFIFFFQKLYPFPLVNQAKSNVAAAAGGCILIEQGALSRIGGVKTLRTALIDDCTLATLVKRSKADDRGIWLGLTNDTFSLRDYDRLEPIWNMVARTAFTQLNYSNLLLLGTVIGMFITYLIAPIGLVWGLIIFNKSLILASLATYFLISLSYFPTIKFYQLGWWYCLMLPFIALLYNFMTIDSALRHWQGKGGQWKGRVY